MLFIRSIIFVVWFLCQFYEPGHACDVLGLDRSPSCGLSDRHFNESTETRSCNQNSNEKNTKVQNSNETRSSKQNSNSTRPKVQNSNDTRSKIQYSNDTRSKVQNSNVTRPKNHNQNSNDSNSKNFANSYVWFHGGLKTSLIKRVNLQKEWLIQSRRDYMISVLTKSCLTFIFCVKSLLEILSVCNI